MQNNEENIIIDYKKVFYYILSILMFLGELSLITCGAIHLNSNVFDISDAGAIIMIVVGSFLLLINLKLLDKKNTITNVNNIYNGTNIYRG